MNNTIVENTITLENVKAKLTDSVLVISTLFIVLALGGSLSRIPYIGFLSVMYFHIAVAVAFISINFSRRHFSQTFKAYFVCYTFLVIGVTGIHNFGLSAAGIFFSLASIIVSSMLINLRTSILFVVSTVLVLLLYYYLSHYTAFTFTIEQSAYNVSIGAWAVTILTFAYVSGVSLMLLHRFTNYLKLLLENQQLDLVNKGEELAYSNILLRTIINNLPSSILWKDKNLNYVGANRQFLKSVCRAKGIEHPQQLSGMSDKDFFDEINTRKQQLMDESLIKGEMLEQNYETHIETSTDNEQFFKVQRIALKDNQKEIIGVLVVITDISDIKKLELTAIDAKEQAIRASEAKSKFLANMSHEIRTPLNGMFGLLDLSLHADSKSKKDAFITKAKLSAKLLSQILNDILDISKIEAGKLDFEEIPFNFSDLLLQINDMLLDEAKQKGLAFNIEHQQQQDIVAIGDPTRLLQVMLNLCTNAIKFTDKGSVSVSVNQILKDEQVFVDIQVKDTGIGIDEDTIPHLFNSFSQAETGINRKFGGTGLGLSIVKLLVDIMDGELELESQKGDGTCVTVHLCLPTHTTSIVESPEQTLATVYHRARILVVDDNEINRIICSEILTQEGFEVTLAENGQQALERLSTSEFELILMDIQMPVMDGLAATIEIRKIKSLEKLPIVALTANVMKDDIDSYEKHGFTTHVAKPFQRQTLLKTVGNLI